MLTARDHARHVAWCAMSSAQRIEVGHDWYRTRNLHPQPEVPAWTEQGRVRHRARVKRSVALLIAMQAEPADKPDVAGLQAELDAAREEMGRLRLRADLGAQLADAQSEMLRVTALLCTDDRFTGADTAPILMPGPRRSRSAS